MKSNSLAMLTCLLSSNVHTPVYGDVSVRVSNGCVYVFMFFPLLMHKNRRNNTPTILKDL